MAGRKVFYTIGGTGRKMGEDSGKYKQVAPGRFTKASRSHKPILSTQTRIHDSLTEVKLVNI